MLRRIWRDQRASEAAEWAKTYVYAEAISGRKLFLKVYYPDNPLGSFKIEGTKVSIKMPLSEKGPDHLCPLCGQFRGCLALSRSQRLTRIRFRC
jgi:hypothetical protein